MQIPWIAWGGSVKHDFTLTEPITTCDTAATALWLLDVPASGSLDGQPVASAFIWQGNHFAPKVRGTTNQQARLNWGPPDQSLPKD